MDRESSLALLRAHHTFPGSFEFRAVVLPHAAPAAIGAMVAAAGEGSRTEHVDERRSSKGTYVALHVRIFVQDAERVLDVWEVLRAVEGVLTTM
jgi:putative lipoic acid-binding regulatory protein